MPRTTRDRPYPSGTAKSGTLALLVSARTVELIERAVQINYVRSHSSLCQRLLRHRRR